MQLCLPAPDRVDPAEGDREAADRFPLQVVGELAVVVAVQCQPVTAPPAGAQHPRLAHPGHRADRRRRHAGAQDRRPLQFQEGTVEHQAGQTHRGGVAAPTNPVQPERDHQTAGRMAVHHRPAPGVLGADDGMRPLQFAVIARQVGGEVRGVALPPGTTALAQIEPVEPVSRTGEMVRETGVEEIVRVPVHRQERRARRREIRSADHCGEDVAFTVGIGSEWEGDLPVPGQNIVLPRGGIRRCRHEPNPNLTVSRFGCRDNLGLQPRRPAGPGSGSLQEKDVSGV